jgi:hypothetical protein
VWGGSGSATRSPHRAWAMRVKPTKRKKKESSFLKKRSKRLLFFEEARRCNIRFEKQKFFGSFFQKRTYFLTEFRLAKGLIRG